MIPTSNYESRQGARVRLVALHTSEGATTVASLGHYFQTTTNQVSYHGAMDDQGFDTFVDYSQAAWSILSANHVSDNAAFCCSAVAQKWSRADWLSHPRMLELGAAWVADRCLARGLPIRRLVAQEIRDCMADPNHPGGVIMHRDYTLATGDGTHVDCGDAFPFDLVLARAQQIAAPPLRSRRREATMELPPTEARIDCQVPTDVVGGWCGQANLLLSANTDGNANTAKVYGVLAVVNRGDTTPPAVTPLLDNKAGQTFVQWWSRKYPLPTGTTSVIVNYSAPYGMVARVEYER